MFRIEIGVLRSHFLFDQQRLRVAFLHGAALFQQPHEQPLKQQAQHHHDDGPGEEVRCLQIGFRRVHLPANGGLGRADDLRHDAGFPAHAQGHPAGADDEGHQRRAVEVAEEIPAGDAEFLCGFQQVLVHGVQPRQGAGVDQG